MDDAALLAAYTKRIGLAPEQVQDFYPTPGTASTVMYYTGLDPFTGKAVYTATNYREKQLQRALLQWRKPENRRMIYEAMHYCTEEGQRYLQELLAGRPPKKQESRPDPQKKKENPADRQENPSKNPPARPNKPNPRPAAQKKSAAKEKPDHHRGSMHVHKYSSKKR